MKERKEYQQLLSDAAATSRQLEEAMQNKDSELRACKAEVEDRAILLRRADAEVARLTELHRVGGCVLRRCHHLTFGLSCLLTVGGGLAPRAWAQAIVCPPP